METIASARKIAFAGFRWINHESYKSRWIRKSKIRHVST